MPSHVHARSEPSSLPWAPPRSDIWIQRLIAAALVGLAAALLAVGASLYFL